MDTSKFILKDSHWQLLEKECGITRESAKRDIETLKEWMEKHPYLPNLADDAMLTSFLITCKNSMEKTKTRLEQYFTLKTKYPEIYRDRSPNSENIKKVYQSAGAYPAGGLTPEGYLIIVLPAMVDESIVKSLSVDELMKGIFMSQDIGQTLFPNRGIILIFDESALTGALVAQFVPAFKKFVTCTLQGAPFRLHSIFVLNMPSYGEVLVNIAKMMMKKHMADRIKLVKGTDELHNFISKENLPNEYGGTAGRWKELQGQWYDFVKAHSTWFEEQESLSADIRMLPSAPQVDDVYGTEGSFRKIAVD